MITIKFITPTERFERTANLSDTIKQALDENDIEYTTATVHLDGVAVSVTDMHKSFEELGIKDKCTVAVVQKLTNA